MKSSIKISFFICLLMLTNASFATNGEEKKSTTNSESTRQQGDKKQPVQKLDLTEETIEEEPVEEQTQSVDSTEDSSVSKYNFIFYFLYKVKYNEDQEDLMF